MYDTREQWGEKQTPADDVFRRFAADLGLDITAFDAAYNDLATLKRVRLDVADRRALGVQGTPTFFLNGTRFHPRSYEDVTTHSTRHSPSKQRAPDLLRLYRQRPATSARGQQDSPDASAAPPASPR